MLNKDGFDRWAEDYDGDTAKSDGEGSYPFAGYQRVLNTIARRVLARGTPRVLDLGFGTGTLTERFYRAGCQVFGQDFSPEMLAIARGKMPGAGLYLGDLAQGLAPELAGREYDCIVATYSLHHLTDGEKVRLLRALRERLRPGGAILIGDVAFESRAALEACRAAAGESWDGEEVYFVVDELREALPGSRFEKLSPCAGILTLERA